MTKGWYGNKQAHALASRGIKSKIDLGEDFSFEEGGSPPPNFPSRFGYDINQTVVHGTSYNRAKEIMEDGWLRNGTFVYGGRGGFEDASIWSHNIFGDNAVVIMAEVEEDISARRNIFGSGWITLGKRGREREGIDTIMDKLKIKKMKVFKVMDDVGAWKGTLIEIPELEIKE